mgnify:CR=1 FL=1
MEESNKMKEIPVNKLMVQMGIPMILSMALQAVYNIVDTGISGTDAYGGSRNRNRCGNECASCKNSWRGKKQKSCESRRKQSVFRCDNLCGMSVVWHFWSEGIHFITDG